MAELPAAEITRIRRRHGRSLPRLWERRDIRHFVHHLISLICVLAVVWSGTSTLWVPDPAEAQTFSQTATLTVIAQPVEVQRASGSRDTASSGSTVNVGDRIFTGEGGAALLTFFQGSQVEIASGSELMVQQMEQRGGTNGASTVGIGQAVGSTISRVASLFNPASRFQVNTPSAVAVVRGTILGTNVNLDGSQSFSCLEGTCQVQAGGQSQTLNDGDSTFIPPPQPTPTGVPSNRGEGRQDDQGGGQGNTGDPPISTPFPSGQLPNVVATAALTAVARGQVLNTPTVQIIATSTPVPGQPTRTPASTSTALATFGTPTPATTPTPQSSPTPDSTPTTVPPTPSPIVPTPAVPTSQPTTPPLPTEEPAPPPPADTPAPSATPIPTASSTPSPTGSPTGSPTASATASATVTAAPTIQPGTNVSLALAATGSGLTGSISFANVTTGGAAAVSSTVTSPAAEGFPAGTSLLNNTVYTLSTTGTVDGGFTLDITFGAAFAAGRAADVQLQYRDAGQWVVPSQT
ncbi:MAG TPA: FecR domain-containing protein, partial [Acidimicrobiales bacterium]|nr:FecR domain-containing protein [Acidimicrobiales bacterium]